MDHNSFPRSTTNAAYDLEANQIPASNYNNPLATGTAQQVKFEENRDWSDWILFGVGWICGITWIVGALRPLCRRPRFPAARNKAGWVANVICSIILIAIIIAAAVVASKHQNDLCYYYGDYYQC